jgi:26S proteasome regulatory subunit N1
MSDPTKTPVAVAASAGKAPAKKQDKKGADGKDANELSEEDQRIKGEVELLVARSMDADDGLALAALTHLSSMLRTATGTVGSIPKPLKFSRAHYATLKTHADTKLAPSSKAWKAFHDVLSFIAMTKDIPDSPYEALVLKLKGNTTSLEEWGHEYLRFLAGLIAEVYPEWSKDSTKDMDTVLLLARQIVAYMVSHQDEAVACDLAIDIKNPALVAAIEEPAFAARVCHYLRGVASFLPAPEAVKLNEIVFDMSMRHGFWSQATRIAIANGKADAVSRVIAQCPEADKLQSALIAGRMRFFIPPTDVELIDDAVGNLKLSELYRFAAQDLDCAAPKKAEDVLKEHLIDKALVPAVTTANSQNLALATSFTSALVNAGYGTDKLLTADAGGSRIHDVSDHRVISSTAALGLVHLWDHEQGLAAVDRFTYAEDPNVKAGALLATGMLMSGLRSPFDPALGLLESHVSSTGSREIRIGAVLGLGLAYAGTRREEVMGALAPSTAAAAMRTPFRRSRSPFPKLTRRNSRSRTRRTSS